MKKTFKISISYLAIGGFLLGGFLLGGQLLLAVEPDIAVVSHLNFGAYTVTPIQLNQGENIECDLKRDDANTTECKNATPYGDWAQVGEFTISPDSIRLYPTDYRVQTVYMKVSYIEGSVNLKEAGVELELHFYATRGLYTLFSGGTTNTTLAVFKPLESPVAYLAYIDGSFVYRSAILASAPKTIKVYGKLIVSDPLKFFAYRTKHNIKDASKLLGTLAFEVNSEHKDLFPSTD